jgi:hypothetical protein
MLRMAFRSHANQLYLVLITIMIIAGVLRIGSTYSVFWQTWDETPHIAAGLQWLDQGRYTFEPGHPPLARVMEALGLYIKGIRVHEGASTYDDGLHEGNAILQSGGTYEQNLTLARIGVLPFFIAASIVVAVWTKRLGGKTASLLATFLFTTIPVILAHAGIAALDMASTATIVLAFFALSLWLQKPAPWRSIFLGFTVGLAIITKFNALIFLLVGFGAICLVISFPAFRKRIFNHERLPNKKKWITASLIAILICLLTIWGGYRFSLHTVVNPENEPFTAVDRLVGNSGPAHDVVYFLMENVPIPAHEFLIGIYAYLGKNQIGQIAYFLGEIRTHGWWYFYPVIFSLKTPIPFLLLSGVSTFFVFKEMVNKNSLKTQLIIPLTAVAGIFLISMAGGVNNGLRQILSVYPFLAIMAGYGTVRFLGSDLLNLRQIWKVALIGLLLVWHLAASIGAHPDYLAYFNEFVKGKTEAIVVDSDLDWGQDLKRLSEILNSRGVSEVYIMYNGSLFMDLNKFNLPAWKNLPPYRQVKGWVAISVYALKLGTTHAPYDQFSWLEKYDPVDRVGKSILLYYIP